MKTTSKRLGLAMVGVLVVLASGCGAPPCNAASCPTGCCAANGLCITTSTANACGAQGQSCLVCPGGQTCAGGLCVNSGSGGGSSGSGGGRASGGGGGGGGGVTNPNAPTCSASEDCPNWVCECGNGPVNSRRCVNNRCQDGAQACPGACAGFNTCWRGLSSGGFPSGSTAGPSTCGGTGGGGGGSGQTCPVSDLGRACQDSSDCQSALCFGVNPSYICTRSCTAASDCPRSWECVTTTGGTRVCMLGPKTSTGTASTSDVCRAISISDVGSTCSDCQSNFCSGNLCSKRCASNADCPSSWSCVTGDFRYCAP